MANIAVTYSFSNGTTADATQVNENFTNIINGLSDGTKDISVSAITAAGTATFNGAVVLGNATGDDITVTGSIASSIPIKTDDTYDLGSTTLRLNQIHAHEYYGTKTNDTATAGYIGEIIAAANITSNVTGSSTAGTYTDSGASITLTAGDWDIYAGGSIYLGGVSGAGAGQYGSGSLAITDNSNTILLSQLTGGNQSDATSVGSVALIYNVQISSSTTYKLRFGWYKNNAGVSATDCILTGDGNAVYAYFFARRRR